MKAILIVVILTTTFASYAQSPQLLALSKADHTLAIVDASTLKVLGKVPVGSDPHEVIASTDGKTAYVSIYGGGAFHEINVIDLINKKPLNTIDTRPLYGPHGLDFVDGKCWFSAEGSKAVGRYDPATGKLDWSMGTGQERTHMLYVTAWGKRIYTTNVNAGTVSILVDTIMPAPAGGPGGPPPGGARSNWMQFIVPVSRGSEGFDLSPDGRELWTASSDDGKIYIVETATMKQSANFDAGVQGANRVKFTPDGKLVFVTSLRSSEVFIFDAASRKELKRINIGHGAAGIQMDPNGSRAFVACTPDNYIAIIDLKSLQISGRLEVGGNPDGMAWSKGY